jgi:hypothetical protein
MSIRTDQLAPQGALTGRVSDAAGNAVAQAQINLIEAASRQSRAANTDEQGQFKINDLPPGNYSVTVQASGFKQQQIAELKLEGRRDLALKLEPGSTSETVMIASESAAAKTAPAASAASPSTVEKRETTMAPAPPPAASGRNEVAGVRKKRDGGYALIEPDAPAKRAARPPSKPVEDDETVRAMTRKVRDKVFRYERGRWIDAAFKPETLLPRLRFERGSDEFRRVVEEHPALKPFFDELSGYVIVVWQGKVYEVRN